MRIGVGEKAMQPPAIEFRNVSISFGEIQALRDVSLTLDQRNMICITGDSGSGKSVLLRLAIGFLQPDEGEMLINGVNITAMEESELLALRRDLMGMVFQENALFTGQTVFENAAYRLMERNWHEDEIERAVLEILTFVGLHEELEKPVEELSGGMKRRLELARALIGWPSIMLYDEPTAGLDPINARQVLDLIIRARDLHRISSLLVTKAMHEIPYLAGHEVQGNEESATIVTRSDELSRVHVCLLEEGGIAFYGSPHEFAQSSLPAVQHMLHPVSDVSRSEIEVIDPWRGTRQSKLATDQNPQ